jgi:hypothetical protein
MDVMTCALTDQMTAFWHWLLAILTGHNFWDPLLAAALGTLVGTGATFWFERRRREDERASELHRLEEQRIHDEIGKCHALHYWIMRKASILRDLHAQLFAKRDGKSVPWFELGLLFGAPNNNDDFTYRDYAFLLDTRETSSPAPKLMSAIGSAVENFKAALNRLSTRNELWRTHIEEKSNVGRGEGRIPGMLRAGTLAKGIEELTDMLRKDVCEGIPELEAVQDLLVQVMSVRYPNRMVIFSSPKPGEPSFSPINKNQQE